MASFITGTVVIYRRSVAPYNQAQEEATVIARREVGISNVTDFYWYNGSETYFTIVGTTDENEEIIAIIKQEDGSVTSIPVDEAIAQDEAIRQVINEKSPERILEARVGIEGDLPVWEVSYRYENGRIGYYLLNLQTGEWLRTIENI